MLVCFFPYFFSSFLLVKQAMGWFVRKGCVKKGEMECKSPDTMDVSGLLSCNRWSTEVYSLPFLRASKMRPSSSSASSGLSMMTCLAASRP